jgi:hypothetical protein
VSGRIFSALYDTVRRVRRPTDARPWLPGQGDWILQTTGTKSSRTRTFQGVVLHQRLLNDCFAMPYGHQSGSDQPAAVLPIPINFVACLVPQDPLRRVLRTTRSLDRISVSSAGLPPGLSCGPTTRLPVVGGVGSVQFGLHRRIRAPLPCLNWDSRWPVVESDATRASEHDMARDGAS